MIRFNPPPDDSPLTPVECRAVVARALYNYALVPPSWSAVCQMADAGDVHSQATQAAEMRRAKGLIDIYERRAAGIKHGNPISIAEGARCVKAGLAILRDGLDQAALIRAAKAAGVTEAMARAALTEYGAAVHRLPNTAGHSLKQAVDGWRKRRGL